MSETNAASAVGSWGPEMAARIAKQQTQWK